MALSSQVQIISCDTGNLYSHKEERLHLLNHKLKMERNALKTELKKVEEKIKGCWKSDVDQCLKDLSGEEMPEWVGGLDSEKVNLCTRAWELNQLIKSKATKVEKTKQQLLDLLSRKADSAINSHGTDYRRELHDNAVAKMRVVSVFESALTRIIGAKPDQLTEDFIVLQVYYFDVLRQIIETGFDYHGSHYIYFTSSAGQIRTKKCVFIKEDVYNRYEKTIMCGLTVEKINELGGINPN